MKKYNFIYIITNTLDGKIYIGKHTTNTLNDNYFGSGLHIKRAIKKYGKENFTKEILAYTDTKDSLNQLEKYYIRKYKAQNPKIGYNLTAGGDGGYIPKTEDGKKRLSEKHKGKPRSEETKRKISEGHKGLTPWNKGVPQHKYKWKTPSGEIKFMDIGNAHKHHPDWIKIN